MQTSETNRCDNACDVPKFAILIFFHPNYGLLLELHTLTLVARSYVLLMHVMYLNLVF